ncbi:hypothetical protein BGZ51_001286 [Haplosporangium sp. Z 767]|nr:hypothetical protein BGZ51_001286 [Haplosporangium sp. Z 767]
MTSDGSSQDGSGSRSGWSSTFKSWRSIVPGYGPRPDEDDNTLIDPDPSSHQVTDYQEGERRDIHGNIVRFENAAPSSPAPAPTPAPASAPASAPVPAPELNTKPTPVAPELNTKPAPVASSELTVGQEIKDIHATDSASSVTTDISHARQQTTGQTGVPDQQTSVTIPTVPTSSTSSTTAALTTSAVPSDPESNVIKGPARKTVDTFTKEVRKRRKNVVLPDYYEQFPDVQPSLLLTVPVGSTEMDMVVSKAGAVAIGSSAKATATSNSLTGRFSSFMRSAVSTIGSLFSFSGATDSNISTGGPKDMLQRGTYGIRKVAIIGIHGWYPRKALRTVIGEPTGTSQKFCEEMDLALKEYLRTHDKHLDPKGITLIPLEGEGKVLDRVKILHQNLVENETWRNAVHEADLVLVATHSQGTPTSILLIARLIEEELLRVKQDDPWMQRIGILTMAGISHGPFPFLKGNLIVRFFEAEAAKELFEFMDSETHVARKYRDGLRTVLSSGVRLTCVASLEDQVVPLYSAIMTSIHHPSIVRAVYIDGTSYQNDFLINLIAFSLRLRNAGVDDHGILVHLSEVIAGSLYGEGHSTIYEEREVYLLSIRSLLEPPASLTFEKTRSEPVLNPFRAKQRLNPFFLPWGMRGIADEITARGDQILIKELERLKRLYNEWNPVTKAMKEIKFRLEPVRSKL